MSTLDRPIAWRYGMEARRENPLRYWRHAAPQLAHATHLTNTKRRIVLRAPNGVGKTEWGTALIAACCMGLDSLAGVSIPRWRGRVDAIEFARDYKQQKLSTQQTWLRLLGSHPHHCRWIGDDILSSIRIRHADSTDDEATWSLVTFMSQENRRAGTGARADIWRFDEPGVLDIVREMRKAGHANRRSLELHTFTPWRRAEWYWYRDEFGDNPRGAITHGDGWAEIRMSLDDNVILTPERKRELRLEYGKQGKELARAREFGDYADTSGSMPWGQDGLEVLLEMLREAKDPLEVLELPIQTEDAEGRPRLVRRFPVEIFERYEPGSEYGATIDSSSGIDDGQHDPFELQLTKIGSGKLVSRAGGYLPGKYVGILGAGLLLRYGEGPADFEVNDRWGVNVQQGFFAAGYTRFCHEQRQLRPGEWIDEPGFHNNLKTRPLIIGAIQTWLADWRAGVRYGETPSRFVLQQLIDCVLAEDGIRIEAAPGLHDDAMICQGQRLRRFVTRSNREVPEWTPPEETPEQRLWREIHEEREDPQDGYGLKPRFERARV